MQLRLVLSIAVKIRSQKSEFCLLGKVYKIYLAVYSAHLLTHSLALITEGRKEGKTKKKSAIKKAKERKKTLVHESERE